VHVGQHAALRREPRGIATGSGRERWNVVGQQALQIRRAVGPRDGNLLPRRDRSDRGVFPNVAVILVRRAIGCGKHVSRADLIRSRQMRFFYFTCALALTMAAPAALDEARAEAAQQAPATAKPTTYKVFLGGTQVGTELVTVREDATGTTITAQAGWEHRSMWSPARRDEVRARRVT
jgi:hypothetical protein